MGAVDGSDVHPGFRTLQNLDPAQTSRGGVRNAGSWPPHTDLREAPCCTPAHHGGLSTPSCSSPAQTRNFSGKDRDPDAGSTTINEEIGLRKQPTHHTDLALREDPGAQVFLFYVLFDSVFESPELQGRACREGGP